MGKRKSKTRNRNHDDPSNNKTCDSGGVASRSWSELNHDVLYLVMMGLGVVDFVAFSGVCKSWRSLALHNGNMFMASKPPMLMSISTRVYDIPPTYSGGKFFIGLTRSTIECCLEDFEGRKCRSVIPHSHERTCIGLTCGYLILFGEESKDFWLVNPITRNELHFPPLINVFIHETTISAILVFSASISRWVFVMAYNIISHLWYSIEGMRSWNTVPIHDLQTFKGKIYTINKILDLHELRLDAEPKLTLLNAEPNLMLLEMKNFLGRCRPKFLGSGESLYIKIASEFNSVNVVYKLDFSEMKWVQFEEAREENVFFLNASEHVGPEFELSAVETMDESVFFLKASKLAGAVKPGSWAEADPWPQFRRSNGVLGQWRFWYFPHECLKVNLLNE